MGNKSSNWDRLCCNIFRVCHRVQTLTQTLCPFRNSVTQASSGGGSINRSPGNQERTHVRTLPGVLSNLGHVILCLPERRSVHWFVAHRHSPTNGGSGNRRRPRDGRVQQRKCLTFLSFSRLLEGGEKEGGQQGEGRDMFRPRPNNKELHKQRHFCSHSFTFTVHYSLQPDILSSVHITH